MVITRIISTKRRYFEISLKMSLLPIFPKISTFEEENYFKVSFLCPYVQKYQHSKGKDVVFWKNLFQSIFSKISTFWKKDRFFWITIKKYWYFRWFSQITDLKKENFFCVHSFHRSSKNINISNKMMIFCDHQWIVFWS